VNVCHCLYIHLFHIHVSSHIKHAFFIHVFCHHHTQVIATQTAVFRCYCHSSNGGSCRCPAIDAINLRCFRSAEQLSHILHFVMAVSKTKYLHGLCLEICRFHSHHFLRTPVQFHAHANHASFAHNAHGSWS